MEGMTTSLASKYFSTTRDAQVLFGRLRSVAALQGVVDAVESLDASAFGHSARVAALSVAIARETGRFTRGECAALHEAALLHDVGKVAVPTSILTKPGRLSAAEFATVKQHAALGGLMVAGVLTPEQSQWVRHHHERWDGAGYPDGIPSRALHPAVGVMCLADSFDAMVSREYPREMTRDAALAECARHYGRQFAPVAATALMRLADRGALPGVDIEMEDESW
jgi:HD-GYP domain-containing protein (c-di-GMP phosphodiesterase class II)